MGLLAEAAVGDGDGHRVERHHGLGGERLVRGAEGGRGRGRGLRPGKTRGGRLVGGGTGGRRRPVFLQWGRGRRRAVRCGGHDGGDVGLPRRPAQPTRRRAPGRAGAGPGPACRPGTGPGRSPVPGRWRSAAPGPCAGSAGRSPPGPAAHAGCTGGAAPAPRTAPVVASLRRCPACISGRRVSSSHKTTPRL